jgi:Tfp pilus assembly PilM family ATPase
MPKAPTSAIGLDLGRYALKSVLIQRKGSDRFILTHFASLPVTEPPESVEVLGQQVKALLKAMGGSAKAYGVAVSSPDSLIRIIEQPETPPDILRDALRLNGMALLNQDTKEFVLDCDEIPASESSLEPGQANRKRYLVGGLPRTQVSMLRQTLDAQVGLVDVLQLAPICALNAFEFTFPSVFNTQAFFLVEIGHLNSTVMVGVKRELVLVRTIDFGGKALMEALTGLSGESEELVFKALEQEDEVMVEYTRVAVNALVREIQSSIGFLEHRHEETVHKVFVSGGASKSQTLLKVLGEELELPCESWSAVSKCESTLPASRAASLSNAELDLNVACGVATEILKGI